MRHYQKIGTLMKVCFRESLKFEFGFAGDSSMKKYFSLIIFMSSLYISLLCPSAHSQQESQPLATIRENSVAIRDKYTDVDGHDLLNPALPFKYCHGFRQMAGNGLSGRLPIGPIDRTARENYLSAQELREIGFAYLTYHSYNNAIAQLKHSLLLWPDSAATYRWLAEAYEAKGQTKEAITNYRLLFYGWPGKYLADENQTKPKTTPADKPSDYDQPNPEETDPTLLMQFSLLLQHTGQTEEARAIYERGMQLLSAKFSSSTEPLPSLLSENLSTPELLEAATRVALAIDQISSQDKVGAKENLLEALRLQAASPEAVFYQQKLSKQ
jgi:tetratricopeptide (TPR) repeat protein